MDLVKFKEQGKTDEHNRFLLTKCNTTINTFPFSYGSIDDYFPEPLYQSLANNFPQETLRINYHPDLSLAGNNAKLQDFWHRNPCWKVLLEFFASERFLLDIQKFISPACMKERGKKFSKKWQYIPDWSEAPRDKDIAPIKVNFKFSNLAAGEWSPPHTDLPCKLFSIILYFPEPDWSENYGGATEIYQPKYSVLNHNWHDAYAPITLMNRWQSLAFIPNRLVFLLKTKNSWHGMSPLTCPSGKQRKSLLISFHDTVRKKGNPKERLSLWITHRLISTLRKFETSISQRFR